MKVSDIVKYKVNRFQKGYVFTYTDIGLEEEKKEAVIKSLNRMVNAGLLKKIAKGRYYKPEISPFGELRPKQEQVVKDILGENGYLTGVSIFRDLGLTTQIGNTIQIGKNDWRPPLKRDRYTIKFLRQKNIINKENIPLLQILDSIRLIKAIPDTDLKNASSRLISIIRNLAITEANSMVRLARKYPASTRALLGLYLEEAGKVEFSQALRKSINPISRYKYPEISSAFPNAINWNIV
jgi:hypothetical protein